MGRKSSKRVKKLKEAAFDKKLMNVRKWADKKGKTVRLNQLAKDTGLNKVFKLVSRPSKVHP